MKKLQTLCVLVTAAATLSFLGGCANSANHRVLNVEQAGDDTLTCSELSSEKRKAQAIISGVERDKEDYSGDDIIDGILWFPFNVIAKQSNYSSATKAAEARIDHISSLEVENRCKVSVATKTGDKDITDQLKLLNASFKANLLSKEEYLAKREKILGRIDAGLDSGTQPDSPVIRIGRYSYEVEQLAKANGCRPLGGAELISQQETLEFYKVGCDGMEPFIFRCEYQVCNKQG